MTELQRTWSHVAGMLICRDSGFDIKKLLTPRNKQQVHLPWFYMCNKVPLVALMLCKRVACTLQCKVEISACSTTAYTSSYTAETKKRKETAITRGRCPLQSQRPISASERGGGPQATFSERRSVFASSQEGRRSQQTSERGLKPKRH
ncbi:hypothetical protein T10_950 [Trichinella papuae]|uniref:Uncharacterized protein n=1 Tax=Trichinella papuae TaxID=268474 RepID=A0A0V1MBS6_9BILA|nr:hypothetical protein T10_950 [Trichinella papuae]